MKIRITWICWVLVVLAAVVLIDLKCNGYHRPLAPVKRTTLDVYLLGILEKQL